MVLILLFGPITQETVALLNEQYKLGVGTGSIAASTSYQVTNPPFRDAGQYLCRRRHSGEDTLNAAYISFPDGLTYSLWWLAAASELEMGIQFMGMPRWIGE